MSNWTYERVADLLNTQLEDQEFIAHSFRVFPCKRGIFGGYESIETEFILHLTNFRIILENDPYLNRKVESFIIDFINLAHHMKYQRKVRKEAKAQMKLLEDSSISILYSQIERFEFEDGKVRIYPIKNIKNRDLNIFFNELNMFTFSASPAYIRKIESDPESNAIDTLANYFSPPDKDLGEELVGIATTIFKMVKNDKSSSESYKKLEFLYQAKLIEEAYFIRWTVGEKVSHEKFGNGIITKKFGVDKFTCFGIQFETVGVKIIDPKVDKLRKIGDQSS